MQDDAVTPLLAASNSFHQQVDLAYVSFNASESDDARNTLQNNNDKVSQGIIAKQQQRMGTVEGVVVPCLLSIFGAVLFLRLSWVVGQCGWLGALLILAVSAAMVVTTALSLAAITSNGIRVGDGGPYFVISRVLGPEFGSAVGVVYTLALCVSVGFYMQAFAESLWDTFFCTEPEHEPCSKWHETNQATVMMIASATLLVVVGVSLLGTKMMARLNWVILVMMAISVGLGTLNMFVGARNQSAGYQPDVNATTMGERNEEWYYAQPSLDRFWQNTFANFTDGTEESTQDDGPQSFLTVFLVFFPGLTGIMAGANLSGELRNSSRAIGVGTLSALAFSITVYAFLILAFGAVFDRDMLQSNKLVFQQNCFEPMVVVLGLIVSTLSSALGNLVGAARVLQAFAKDKLVPIFDIFAYVPTHHRRNQNQSQWQHSQGNISNQPKGEPVVAIAMCWFIAQCALLVGNLNILAAAVGLGFLVVYFCLNLACFVLKVSGAPNFRPRFHYFSWHSALLGVVLTLFVMFLASPVQSLIGLTFTGGFGYYVYVRAPVVAWGDVTQALLFHQVRKFLLRLDVRKEHPKFWRPSVLLVMDHTQPTREQQRLIDFCNNLKKGGLYVIGTPLVYDCNSSNTNHLTDSVRLSSTSERIREHWLEVIESSGIKAFPEVAVAQSRRHALINLLLGAGLGGMKPNTVVMRCITANNQFVASPDQANNENNVFDHLNAINELARDFNSSSSNASSVQEVDNNNSNNNNNGSSSTVDIDADLRSDTCADLALFDESEEKVNFCHLINDCLAFSRNVAVTSNFELLDKVAIAKQHHERLRKTNDSRRRTNRFGLRRRHGGGTLQDNYASMNHNNNNNNNNISNDNPEDEEFLPATIDIWTTDYEDWDDPAGTLALQLQLAWGLNRTSVWQVCTRLRVVAAVSIPGSDLRAARVRLVKLLAAVRVEADVLVMPSVGAALFDVEEEEDGIEEYRHNSDADSEENEINALDGWTRRRGGTEGDVKRAAIQARDDHLSTYSTNVIELSDRSEDLPRTRNAFFHTTTSNHINHDVNPDDFSEMTHRDDQQHQIMTIGAQIGLGEGSQQQHNRSMNIGSLPPPTRTRPLTQLEHCAELNALVAKSSGARAAVVFVPLPLPPHTPDERSAQLYIENLRCLTQGLPPCVLVTPGRGQDIVTTEI